MSQGAEILLKDWVRLRDKIILCTMSNPNQLLPQLYALVITHLLSSGGRGPSLSLTGLLPAVDVDAGGSLVPAVGTEVETVSTLPLVEVEDSDGLGRPSTIRRLIPELQNKRSQELHSELPIIWP